MDKTYQCTGAYCSETCNINLYQGKIGNSNPLTNSCHITAPSCLVKWGGTYSQELLQVAQEIWDYRIINVSQSNRNYSRVLTKQSEYSGILATQIFKKITNIQAIGNWTSKIFSQIVKIRGILQIDLYYSRLNHQLPKYMSWHLDPDSCAVDSLQHACRNLYGHALYLIGKVFAKVRPSLFFLS